MTAKEFKDYIWNSKDGKAYGICPPPIDCKECFDILVDHFLGEDWYTTLPIGEDQVNTEAVYEILRRYPKKQSIIKRIIAFIKKLRGELY